MTTKTVPGTGSGTLDAQQRVRAKRAVVAASIGNALEWYDILVYGFFAVVISKVFFPNDNAFISLALTFGTFAISYLVRPIGAMVIGSYGDKRGRKAALNLTILLMMIGTTVLTFAPTHAQIGAAAGLIVLLSRMVQGFSAGGEFGSATAFLTENAAKRKAFYASWQVATQGASLLAAAAMGFILTGLLSDAQLSSWGWRFAVGLGMLIGPVGMYIRNKMEDTPEFTGMETLKSPLSVTLRHNFPRVLTAAGCVGVATLSMYLLLYMPTYAIKNLHLPSYSGYLGGAVGGLVTLICAPMIGKLADRVGCVTVMRPAALAGLVLVWPLFAFLVSVPNLLVLTLIQGILGLVMAFYFAPLPALMSSIFPTNIRTTGMSLAYNIGVTLFGGIAPIVLALLVESTGLLTSPSFYYMVIAAISFVALNIARKKYGQA